MARKIKKKCCVCGKEYEIVCPNCSESANQPTWLNSFCCETCRDVYNACSGYYGKAYSAQEARALLDLCDLSNKENYTPSTQNLIKEIYANSVEKKEVKEDVKVEVKEEQQSAKPQFKKNKNFKKNK